MEKVNVYTYEDPRYLYVMLMRCSGGETPLIKSRQYAEKKLTFDLSDRMPLFFARSLVEKKFYEAPLLFWGWTYKGARNDPKRFVTSFHVCAKGVSHTLRRRLKWNAKECCIYV